MFSFQSGELSFQISTDVDINTFTTPNYDPHQPPFNNIDSTTSNLIKSPKSKKGRSSKAKAKATAVDAANNANTANHDINNNNNNNNNNNEISGNDVAKKKISHREVERQRRQEMSNLHSSLRSLLPLEYVRGKRSICDHVTEATKYIKELEKNVRELGDQRDKLKHSVPSSVLLPSEQHHHQQLTINNDREFGCSSSGSVASISTTSEYSVSIHKFSRTLQIEIAAGSGVGDHEDPPYPLSKALRVLADEGLDVVSCVSSKVNQRWIYVIYCEVDEVSSVESCQLQEKLKSVATSSDT